MKVYLLTLIATVASVRGLKSVEEEWEDFKVKYGKEYELIEEETRRFNNFVKTYEIVKNNNDAESNLVLEINKFSDLSPDELPSGLDISKVENYFENALYYKRSYASVPDSIDWREKGFVTPAKDQTLDHHSLCGSCWAFSTVGALESHYHIKYNREVTLSEQYLVDCDEVDNGCSGGLPFAALQFVKEHGIPAEKLYPYEGREGICRNWMTPRIKINDYILLKPYDEETMKEVVGTIGPITVGMVATTIEFAAYRRGVYKTPCPERNPNHAVLIVGYGTDPVDGDYWIGKNSWGERWGEKGFFKILRNRNWCNISDVSPAYPVF